MRFFTFFVLSFVLLTGTTGIGCSPRSSDEETVTTNQRRNVPADVVDQLIRAQEAYRQGAYNVSLALTDSVERKVPDLADLHFLRGQVYTALEQFERARRAYQRVLSIDSKYQGAHLNMGINAFKKGEFRTALEHYEKERNNHSTAGLWVEMGRAYQRLSNLDSARHSFERAIALDSTKASAYIRLGKLYEDDGNLEKAVTYSRKGLHFDSTNLNYRLVMGAQLVQQGEAEEAIEYLRPVVEARPWHPGAHQSFGQALTLAGNEEKGNDYLLQVDSLEQRNSEIEELQSLAQTHPDQPERWVRLGDALRRNGRLEEAKKAYEVALSHAPEHIALQNNLANLTADQGYTKEAIIRYKSILRQDSTLADVWLNLGVVYANTGNYEKARQAWQEVLKYKPNDPTAREYIARLDR